MKNLFFGSGLILCLAFTSPFMQDGSVDTDSTLIEERQQKALENIKQREKAEKVLLEEKQQNQDEKSDELLRDHHDLHHDLEEGTLNQD